MGVPDTTDQPLTPHPGAQDPEADTVHSESPPFAASKKTTEAPFARTVDVMGDPDTTEMPDPLQPVHPDELSLQYDNPSEPLKKYVCSIGASVTVY